MGDGLKVLMLNGSPRSNGNIALAFHEMEKVFEENGVEYVSRSKITAEGG